MNNLKWASLIDIRGSKTSQMSLTSVLIDIRRLKIVQMSLTSTLIDIQKLKIVQMSLTSFLNDIWALKIVRKSLTVNLSDIYSNQTTSNVAEKSFGNQIRNSLIEYIVLLTKICYNSHDKVTRRKAGVFMKLNELIESLKVYKINSNLSDQFIYSIEMDSRNVGENSLFVCIDGFTVDGHDYVDQAVNNGAKAIVAEKNVEAGVPVILVPDTSKALAQLADYFFGHPSRQLNVIGVTGTNGKTTLTYLLDDIFTLHGHKTAVIGTIDMKIGEKRYPVKNTTPDALFLHKNFRKMIDEGVDTVIMEVSSHALSLGRVYGIEYNTAVYTNLTQDHLDYHQNMSDYAHAKSLLFSQLGTRLDGTKSAIINIDDRYSTIMERASAQPVVTYGLTEDAYVRADDLKLGANYSAFTVVTPDFSSRIETRLSGKFNVYNMLAAIAVAYTYEIPAKTIQKALENTEGVPGRFESVSQHHPISVIVDYAHTPDSLENVLQSISEIKTKKVFTVVGSGGDRDRLKRPKMADAALKYSDYVIFTSDNPRTEDPHAILNDMTGHLTGNGFQVIKDRKEAIQQAIDQASDGDIVLIAGKGHETYQEIDGKRNHFDDREVARVMLEEKYKGS